MAQGAYRWETAIAEVGRDEINIRGTRLSDLIGTVSFAEMAFLVLRGRLPRDGERAVLDAVLVSVAEHGISPSSEVVRMLAACGSPIQGALAGGVLSIADWHGGAGEQAGRMLLDLLGEPGESAVSDLRPEIAAVRDRSRTLVTATLAAGQRFPGFGHPQHAEGDPRVLRLAAVAREHGLCEDSLTALDVLTEEIAAQTGRRLRPNVNGATACLLVGLGFPLSTFRPFIIAPRIIGLTAHFLEETAQGGRWRHTAARDVRYVGPRLRQSDTEDHRPGTADKR